MMAHGNKTLGIQIYIEDQQMHIGKVCFIIYYTLPKCFGHGTFTRILINTMAVCHTVSVFL